MQTKRKEEAGNVIVLLLLIAVLAGMSFIATQRFYFSAKYSQRDVQGNSSFIALGKQLSTILNHKETCRIAFAGLDISSVVSGGTLTIPMERFQNAGMSAIDKFQNLHDKDKNFTAAFTLSEAEQDNRISCLGQTTLEVTVQLDAQKLSYLGTPYLSKGFSSLLTVDANNQVVNCEPLVCPRCGNTNGVINFESFADGASIGAAENAQFSADYGITFTPNIGGDFKIARIMRPWESGGPNWNAWWSRRCSGGALYNQICNPLAGPDPGQRALSTTGALEGPIVEFQIDYTNGPVQDLNFELIDVDGKETWTITAYDGATPPNVIAGSRITSKGYGKRSFNNTAVAFGVTSSSRNIEHIVVRGSKGIDKFGFAFDNFQTGYCN